MRHPPILIPALLSALLPTPCRGVDQGPPTALQPVELRCEHLEAPLAIGVTDPQLSWRVVSAAAERRGQGWNAYRVQVASTLAELEAETPDRWDSGWRPGRGATSTCYEGEPLGALDISWWRVRVSVSGLRPDAPGAGAASPGRSWLPGGKSSSNTAGVFPYAHTQRPARSGGRWPSWAR